jgi:hypothetical protein
MFCKNKISLNKSSEKENSSGTVKGPQGEERSGNM